MPLQDIIHKLTEGTGSRVINLVLVLFGMAGLAIWYDLAAFKNLSTIEGMDNAQLARNLAGGRGFTTQFVRPFSLYLLGKHQKEAAPSLKEKHPDLANAPLYPALLAGVLKIMPFSYPDTTRLQDFSRYLPDLWIAIANQGLFFVGVWMVFRLGRRLFDEPVGWVAAAVFAGTELFWRFSASGLSTQFLILIVLLLFDVLSRMEPAARAPLAPSQRWFTGMAVLAGGLAGLAGMTRYSCGWIILPVLIFLAELPAARRPLILGSCLAAFLAVTTPWIVRNYVVSGTPFGVAGFALLQNTALFQGLELERSLHPNFTSLSGGDFWHKLLVGIRDIASKELPRLGGSWVSAFFLVGLMVPFRSPSLARLRNFVLLSLILFVGVQALGRTGLTDDSPEVNSENLLAIIAPLVFLFGVSLFFILLDQFVMKMEGMRLSIIGAFLVIACLPLGLTLFTPVHSAIAYPPYYPPYIQEKAQWVGEDDLIMADFPWAVAWYGNRQSVWLSLKYREKVSPQYRNDFDSLNHLGKPIRALYLSARTLKAIETKFLTDWLRGQGSDNWEEVASDWEAFVLLGVFFRQEIPAGFPLKRAPFALLPELFLGDSERK